MTHPEALVEAVPTSIEAAARMLRDGSATSEALVEAVQRRADEFSDVGSFITRADERALAEARSLDAEMRSGRDRGPLHGIPIGVKDIIAVAGLPMTAQSAAMLDGFHGGRDAEVVARLRVAGAIVVGTTTTMEFAIGMPDASNPFPLPRNPYDLLRWAGGSSSGSASGVAAGFFLGALGTDSGGSVRLPAAWCGVTGLKPTHRLVPTDGVIPLGYSHDAVGPMARTARDCQILLEVMAPSSRAVQVRNAPVRVGVPTGALEKSRCEPDVAARFEEALDVLRDLGCVLVDVDLPYLPEVRVANDVSMAVEAWSFHRRNLSERWSEYGWQTRTAIGRGALTTGPDYVQAQRVRRLATTSLDAVLDEVDLIASPTHPAAPPLMFGMELLGGLVEIVLTSYWNACGYPALSVPMGLDSAGLPTGLHLGGPAFSEATLLDLGVRYQAATTHHLVSPALAGAR